MLNILLFITLLEHMNTEILFNFRYGNIPDDWEPPNAKPFKDVVNIAVFFSLVHLYMLLLIFKPTCLQRYMK